MDSEARAELARHGAYDGDPQRHGTNTPTVTVAVARGTPSPSHWHWQCEMQWSATVLITVPYKCSSRFGGT